MDAMAICVATIIRGGSGFEGTIDGRIKNFDTEDHVEILVDEIGTGSFLDRRPRHCAGEDHMPGRSAQLPGANECSAAEAGTLSPKDRQSQFLGSLRCVVCYTLFS
jgi:hypothetical protein